MRELENVIERAVVLSSGPRYQHRSAARSRCGPGQLSSALDAHSDASLFDIIEDCERRIIIDMLEKCGWNQTEAAERFHIPLSTLNQKIKRLAIEIKKKNRSEESSGHRAIG